MTDKPLLALITILAIGYLGWTTWAVWDGVARINSIPHFVTNGEL